MKMTRRDVTMDLELFFFASTANATIPTGIQQKQIAALGAGTSVHKPP